MLFLARLAFRMPLNSEQKPVALLEFKRFDNAIWSPCGSHQPFTHAFWIDGLVVVGIGHHFPAADDL